jgi:septum formation protein
MQLGIPFEKLAVDITEQQQPGEGPADYVLRLATDKAEAGLALVRQQGLPDRPVLGADTAVVIDGQILGKPADQRDGLAILERLSGNSHQVYSGIALIDAAGTRTALSTSTVRFRAISAAERQAYWHTGEGADKAGCYAVQGLAAKFIQHIDGSYSGIMGLPLFETAALLGRVGKW